MFVHGLNRKGKRHPAYGAWVNMRTRCYNTKNGKFGAYGARGIRVCQTWRDSFVAFWKDMGPSYRKGLTLERRDNNKGYSKKNCIWISHAQQARNRRNNRIILTELGPLILADAARLAGINHSTMIERLEKGWPVSRLLVSDQRRRN